MSLDDLAAGELATQQPRVLRACIHACCRQGWPPARGVAAGEQDRASARILPLLAAQRTVGAVGPPCRASEPNAATIQRGLDAPSALLAAQRTERGDHPKRARHAVGHDRPAR